MEHVIQLALIIVMQFALASHGVTIDTWQWWVIMICHYIRAFIEFSNGMEEAYGK